MHGRTLFLIVSCVLPVFASPVPIEGVKIRNAFPVANLFPVVFSRRSIVEAIPNVVESIEARGHHTPGGGLKERSEQVDIEARTRKMHGGGSQGRSVEAEIEARERHMPYGGPKERSVEADIEARDILLQDGGS